VEDLLLAAVLVAARARHLAVSDPLMAAAMKRHLVLLPCLAYFALVAFVTITGAR
jgi:hypothetical protein